jgi:hypothetical protein
MWRHVDGTEVVATVFKQHRGVILRRRRVADFL